MNSGSLWQTIAKSVRSLDEEKVKYSKEDVDTLLVFVSFPLVLSNSRFLNMIIVWPFLDRPCRFFG